MSKLTGGPTVKPVTGSGGVVYFEPSSYRGPSEPHLAVEKEDLDQIKQIIDQIDTPTNLKKLLTQRAFTDTKEFRLATLEDVAEYRASFGRSNEYKAQVKTLRKLNALDLAIARNNYQIVKYLIDLGANPKSRHVCGPRGDGSGPTSLKFAQTRKCSSDLISLLK